MDEDNLFKSNRKKLYRKYIKRILDFLCSIILLTVLLPAILIITIINSIVMRGNPFFIQKRPGKIDSSTGKERIFKLIKFRTMTNKTGADGSLLPDRERLGRYGRVMRALSLDEIPELLNICCGDMSFVGPRPLLVEYLPYYSPAERRRHEVRPGLTGYAQINGRNSLNWEQRFILDVKYIEDISFAFDLKIIGKTIKNVLYRLDIAEDTNATEGNFAEIRRTQINRLNNLSEAEPNEYLSTQRRDEK